MACGIAVALRWPTSNENIADVTVDRLAKAARTYLDARAREEDAKRALDAARNARAAAARDVDKAREPLAAEIVTAARNGVRQKDILTRIGNAYTREQVRR